MKTLKAFLVLTIICTGTFSCMDRNEDTNAYRIKQIITTDSMGVEINKLTMNYAGERLITKIQFDKDTIANSWNETSHFDYSYSGDSIVENISNHDFASDLWINIYKIEYTFSNNKIDKVIVNNLENYNGSSTLGNTISYQYTGTNLTELIAFDIKYTLTYENNLLSKFIEYSLDRGNWIEYTSWKYNYSGNQLESINTYDNYGFLTGKFEYEYTNSTISKISYLIFNSASSTWKTDNFTTFHYDNHGYLSDEVQNNGSKTTYLYEAGKGNFSTFKSYINELDKTPYAKVISKDRNNLMLFNLHL